MVMLGSFSVASWRVLKGTFITGDERCMSLACDSTEIHTVLTLLLALTPSVFTATSWEDGRTDALVV
jgi:hypothetical protein